MKVLITNNHIIGNEELKQKSINFSYYDGIIRHLELNSSRRTFTKINKDIDITIIEIKEKDKINHYLKLDENFFQNKAQDFNSFREYRTVYNLFYSNQISYISYGIIKNINEKQIYHSCSTEKGASGSPVCLLGSKKVIGIHVGGLNWESNISVSLKYGINEFLDYLNKNKNEQESIYYVPLQTDKNKNNLNNKNKNNACDSSFVSDNAEKTNHLKNNFNRHIILNEDLDELSYKQNVVFNYVRNINISANKGGKNNNQLNNNINRYNKFIGNNNNQARNYSSSNQNSNLKNNMANQNKIQNKNMKSNNQLINNNKNIVKNYSSSNLNSNLKNNMVNQNNLANNFTNMNNNNANNYRYINNNNFKNNNNNIQSNYQNNINYIYSKLNNNAVYNPNNQNNNVYLVNNLNNAIPNYINNNNYQLFANANNYNNFRSPNDFIPQNKLIQINPFLKI